MSVMAENEKMKFIQKICKKTGTVYRQVSMPDWLVDHVAKDLWQVGEDQDIIVTDTTQVAQPAKFFLPVPKEAIIHIYGEYQDSDTPTDPKPVWTGPATDLEQMKNSAHDVAGDIWNAFTESGEWVGSSKSIVELP